VPLHLRNAPTKLMKSWGNHEGYQYAHDAPGAVAAQQYMPDELVGHEYYHPNERGYEHELGPAFGTHSLDSAWQWEYDRQQGRQSGHSRFGFARSVGNRVAMSGLTLES
jgi:hypothetical protein